MSASNGPVRGPGNDEPVVSGEDRDPLFDPAETRLVTDPRPFLVRTAVRVRIKETFRELRRLLRDEVEGIVGDRGAREPLEVFHCPGTADFARGKMAHGDNFHHLPWVYLDYPRSLGKNERFLFRSFFWWGNFISFGWILEGSLLPGHKERFLAGCGRLPPGRYVVSLDATPWEWGARRDSFLPVRERTVQDLRARVPELRFLKISRIVPLATPGLTRRSVLEEGLRTFRDLLPVVLRAG
jgi:hypothetical protein